MKAVPIQDWLHHPNIEPYVIPSTLITSGVVSFGGTCGICTSLMQMIGCSTAQVKLATLLGTLSVGAASYVSHRTIHYTQHRLETYYRQRLPSYCAQAWWNDPKTVALFKSKHKHLQVSYSTIRVCTLGCIVFTLLGGRFWRVAPSSFTHLGSFARRSIAATESYASERQRAAITKLGRRFGCHTCGRKNLFRPGSIFIGDHMPPKSVAEQMQKRWWRLGRRVQFRFFPQCTDCSQIQGGILTKATQVLRDKKKLILKNVPLYNHGFQWRLYWCTGGVLAGCTTLYAEETKTAGTVTERFLMEHKERLQSQLKRMKKNLLAFS